MNGIEKITERIAAQNDTDIKALMNRAEAQAKAVYEGYVAAADDDYKATVKKGEKGIRILAPAPYKVKQKMEKLDEQGKPILDKDGKPLTEEKTVQIPAFKVVSVFDVSQTEGEPLPSIAVNELSGSVQDYQDFFKALEQASPVPIGFDIFLTSIKHLV